MFFTRRAKISWKLPIIAYISFAALSALGATIPLAVKKTVVFIYLPDAQGNIMRNPQTNVPLPNGTGFFVGIKGDSNRGYGYLVTAKHVLKGPDGKDVSKIFLRLNKKQGDAQEIPLDLTQGGKSFVFTHTDPTVDIAVIPTFPDQSIFDIQAIPEDMIAQKTLSDLGVAEGSEVFFTGLFTSYIGDHRNNPIVRFGRVAMLPEDRITWQELGKAPELVNLYLLETQSYGGNSGSPVFFFLGADRNPGSLTLGPPILKLAGIMRGNFNEPRPISFVQPNSNTAPPIPVSSQNVGIAAVSPGYLLNEILFSDPLKKLRSEH